MGTVFERNFKMKIKGPVYLLGDTHDVSLTERVLMHHEVTDATVIHVGDAGIGRFFSQISESLEEFMRTRNIRFRAIRGNHDDPQWFPHKVSQFFELWEDYTSIEFEELGATALCVGGGISIDRIMREDGFNYWSGEPTTLAPLLESHDLVIAHDCPSWVNKDTAGLPLDFPKFCQADKTLLEDCYKQRGIMDRVFKMVEPSQWWYGHYHNDMHEFVHACHFQCLNISKLHRVC